MGRFDTTKATINANIKKNGNQEITGSILNSVMTEMVDATDAELAKLSERIDNLPKGNEFDKAGNYPLLHVGTADTAIDLAGRGESVPASFGFRASGGKSIKDGRAYIKRIKGNSVVWNQKVKRLNYVSNGVSSNCEGNVITLNGVCTTTWAPVTQGINVIQDHKYLVVGHILTNPNGLSFNISLFNKVPGAAKYDANTNFNWSIGICSGSRVSGFGVDGFPSGTDLTGIQFRTIVIDLTQLFQAGNEPTTIEEYEARKPIVADEYAYNEGQVIHCNTESIKSVGDNAWDEEWIAGRLSTNTGQPNLGNNGITSKNYIRVLPNETYYCGYNAAPIFAMFYDAEYALITGVNGSNNFVSIRNTQFTTPANAAYMKLYVADNNITTYNHDIMITLVHSGWKQDTDAGYQPYWQDTLPLPIIRKYFPDGMKSAGSAHDEIRYNKASGKWEYSKGKIKSVDLGTLNWGLAPQMYFRANLPSDSIIPTGTNYNGFLCAKYERVNFNLIYGQSVTTPCFGVSANNGMIGVYDSAYTDAATFKAAMQGVILYYEAADWEWVELDAEDQNFRDYYNVADFGTEMSQSSVPSANFSADIIYQFNAVDMIREHELEITELQSIIATMQAQLTSLINGGQ